MRPEPGYIDLIRTTSMWSLTSEAANFELRELFLSSSPRLPGRGQGLRLRGAKLVEAYPPDSMSLLHQLATEIEWYIVSNIFVSVDEHVKLHFGIWALDSSNLPCVKLRHGPDAATHTETLVMFPVLLVVHFPWFII